MYLLMNYVKFYSEIFTCVHFNQHDMPECCTMTLKASATPFKRFTSPPFLKSSFSLYAPITLDECHA